MKTKKPSGPPPPDYQEILPGIPKAYLNRVTEMLFDTVDGEIEGILENDGPDGYLRRDDIDTDILYRAILIELARKILRAV